MKHLYEPSPKPYVRSFSGFWLALPSSLSMHNLSLFLPVFSLSFCMHHLDREWLWTFVHGEEGYMFFMLVYKNIIKHFIHPPDFCGKVFTEQKRKTWRIHKFPQCKLCVFRLPLLWKQKILRDQKKNQQNYLGCLSKCMFRKIYF